MNSLQNSRSFNTFDVSYLATLPRWKQKRMIGEHLYPLIYNIYPNFMPHKLTDILLDINSIGALVNMIYDPTFFDVKLKEAVTVLETYYGMITAVKKDLTTSDNHYDDSFKAV